MDMRHWNESNGSMAHTCIPWNDGLLSTGCHLVVVFGNNIKGQS